MNIEALRELVKEYLPSRDDHFRMECFQTARAYAEEELSDFLEWLAARKSSAGIWPYADVPVLSDAPRVITRVMDDGVQTKDGAA